MGYNDGFLDDVINLALRQRKKVTLFLCKDKEGGFGVKINEKIVFRNLPWESFEVEIPEEDYDKIIKKFNLK